MKPNVKYIIFNELSGRIIADGRDKTLTFPNRLAAIAYISRRNLNHDFFKVWEMRVANE